MEVPAPSAAVLWDLDTPDDTNASPGTRLRHMLSRGGQKKAAIGVLAAEDFGLCTPAAPLIVG